MKFGLVFQQEWLARSQNVTDFIPLIHRFLNKSKGNGLEVSNIPAYSADAAFRS